RRDHPGLDHDDDGGHKHEAAALSEDPDGSRERCEQERLSGEQPQPRRPALSPDDQQGDDESQERQEIRGGRHRTTKTAMSDRKARAKDPASSSGTRNSLSFATAVSRRETHTASNNT